MRGELRGVDKQLDDEEDVVSNHGGGEGECGFLVLGAHVFFEGGVESRVGEVDVCAFGALEGVDEAEAAFGRGGDTDFPHDVDGVDGDVR